MSSYAGKLLRVNLSQGECEVEPVVEQLQRSFLGARGFDIRYFYDELAGKIDPLADEGKGEYIASVQCKRNRR